MAFSVEHQKIPFGYEASGYVSSVGEQMDKDSDFDEIVETRSVTDSNSDIPKGYLLEQESVHQRLYRRHSLGGISVFPPASRNQRRASLQTPRRFPESLTFQHLQSCSEMFIRNIERPQIPMSGIGSELFVAFLQEEMNRSNLQLPEPLQNAQAGESTHRGTGVVHEFLNLGTHLRLMADEFASSDHRRLVRERADRVPLSSLDAESFTDLLFGMFQQGGVTCERVLVLFVFCADLAMRALREHLISCFNDVMSWSQIYIESWLTPWVERHGGWAVVLERSVHEAYKAAVICACMMGILALWTFIRTTTH